MRVGDGLILKRFGKYLLLDHFVDGGMAKICRARFLGEEADKIVAIKMIQAQYFADEAFRNMFLDEIRVTFGLIHPNITQTFDYGMEDNQLYQVMEYINGKNLKEYLDKLKKRGYVFPVEVSVYVIAQTCQGLHYAHTFKNQLTAESANIIHRDISPHNIMLTYDGAVKIIDFGIAKASSNSDKTQAGTIKGKLSYLAPEYLDGLELDARYDQFALGITLWEMLCSRKLFSAKNDLAVLKKIQACKVPPPSSINPNVPKALDKIVLKALEKDRELRYENLDQMNRALIKFLYGKYPEFNATDLSYFSQELFKDVIKQDQDRFKEFGKIDIRPFLDEMKKGVPLASKNKIYDDDVIIIQDESEDSGQLDQNGNRTSNKSSTRRTELDLDSEGDGSSKDLALEIEGGKSRANRLDVNKNKAEETRTRTNHRLNGVLVGSFEKDAVPEVKIQNKLGQRSSGTLTGVRNQAKTRTGVRQNLGSTRTKTSGAGRNSTSHSSSGAWFKILVASLCVTLAWYGHEKYLKRQKSLDMAQQHQIVRKVASSGVLRLGNYQNFDKIKYRLYLDGKLYDDMAKVLTGEIENLKIPEGEVMAVRIVYDNEHEYLVKKVRFIDGVASIDVKPFEHMPRTSYANLIGGGNCNAKGTIYFHMFGEDRIESVPIAPTSPIAFSVDEMKKEYEIKYVPVPNDDIDYKDLQFRIRFPRADNQIDICDGIVKAVEQRSRSSN